MMQLELVERAIRPGLDDGQCRRRIRTYQLDDRRRRDWSQAGARLGFSPSYLPDGQHVLYQDTVFMILAADGMSDAPPVNVNGIDLSDLPQGFVYVGHWIPAS